LGQKLLNVGISVGSGLLVALLLFAANVGQMHSSMISPFYLSNSYVLAGGRNVVNVIVVDFRGYDTMGEITVFSVAALAVFAMTRLGRKGTLRQVEADFAPPPSPILQSIARLTLHLMLLFSIYLLLRGHNAPGGGFIAGMLTAVAVILQMVAFDVESFKQEVPWNPLRIVMAGLTVSAFTGLGALAFGRPFLTSAFGHFHLPFLGEIELVTAALFDLGVYLVVVGTTLGIIRTIAEE
jgi:multicomponent K+:H+ antiporter subunit A